MESETGNVIRCFQINLHKSSVPAFNLMKELNNNKKYIAFCQEPYVSFGAVRATPSGSTHYSATGHTKRQRASIIVSNDIPSFCLPQYCDPDTTTVGVKTEEGGDAKQMIVCSAYFPHDSEETPPTPMVRQLTEYCDNKRLPLIIAADTNAHHDLWGSSSNNSRGLSLEEFVMSNNLFVHNLGSKPTFVTAITKQVIDVTFSNQYALNMIHSWIVDRVEMASDHKLIEFKIGGIAVLAEKLTRKIRNIDKNKFIEQLSSEVSTHVWPTVVDSIPKLEACVEALHSAIDTSFAKSCPATKVGGKKIVPWWSKELSHLRKEARKHLRIARRTNLEEDWVRSRTTCRTLKYSIRKHKKENWKKFCSELEDIKPTLRIYKLLKKDPHTRLSMVRKPNGEMTANLEESLDCLLNANFPEPPDTTEEWSPPEPGLPGSGKGITNRIVTLDLVLKALRSFKPYKAPGPDGAHPVLLQLGLPVIGGIIVSLYRASLSLGHIPEIWTKSRVVFIPKPGKKDRTLTNSYRPISLTSFLLKGLERLILWHLMDQPLRQRPISAKQFAYKADNSTENALHELVTEIEAAVYSKKFCLAVFLDISSAFNSATLKSMCSAVAKRNVAPILQYWIYKLLAHREVSAEYLDVVRKKISSRGCPQGGILSPLLWNLTMDGAIETACGVSGIKPFAYADDLCLIISGICPATVGNIMQRCLNRLTAWAKEQSLSFSPAKTEVVMFTRKRKFTLPVLKIKQQTLRYTDRVKYLGVILEKKLSWLPQCEEVNRRALISLGQCRRLMGSTWGPEPKIMHWLYTAVIRPIITYGAVVWSGVADSSRARAVMNRTQRIACLIMTSAYRGTPTAALEAVLDLPPLPMLLQVTAARTAHRLIALNGWRANPNFTTDRNRHWYGPDQIIKEIETARMPADRCRTEYNFDNKFEVIVLNRNEAIKTALCRATEGTVQCFTDGSRTGNQAGAGMIIESATSTLQEEVSLGRFTSALQAELAAISSAAGTLLQTKVLNHNINIFSDCIFALNMLTRNKIKSRLVSSCIHSLNQLATHNNVKLLWVPGHSNVPGNEAADKCAKNASRTPMVGPEPPIGLTLEESLRGFKNWLTTKKQNAWTSSQGCRQAKEAVSKVNATRAQTLISLRRPALKNVMQIITGHANLARHRHIMKQTTSPRCLKCNLNEEETPWHHVAICPAFQNARSSYLSRVTPWTWKSLIDDNLIGLANFLKETKRLQNFTTM